MSSPIVYFEIAGPDGEQKAFENAKSAFELYLEDLSESGDAIPEPRQYHLLSA